jgi:hypothetical protein
MIEDLISKTYRTGEKLAELSASGVRQLSYAFSSHTLGKQLNSNIGDKIVCISLIVALSSDKIVCISLIVALFSLSPKSHVKKLWVLIGC